MIDSRKIVYGLIEKGMKITTAESLTGGLLAAALTDVPGASRVFVYGFITYGTEAKIRLLDLDPRIVLNHGVVSQECAIGMAEGALKKGKADIALSTTGFAGPAGGNPAAPVGTVYIGVAIPRSTGAFRHLFIGNRKSIREQAVQAALRHALEWLK